MSYKEQIRSRKVFLVKFEEHRHRCEARDCTFNFSYKYLLIFQRTATRFNRQMYGKMKTLIVAFLARLSPSNAISKFL